MEKFALNNEERFRFDCVFLLYFREIVKRQKKQCKRKIKKKERFQASSSAT
jgi:hypothetical protein